MASVTASIHLRDDDKPFADTLENGPVALWLTGRHRGPALIGTPEALLEVRRAIGRFLFPDEFAKPVEEEAA